jgi:HPt (histidine-containing phosphotransfer) domain-containing protein
VLNRDATLARVGGNMRLLEELAEVFRSDCVRLLAEIQEAIHVGHAVQMGAAAHTLKGMVGFFEADTARQAALSLETLGRRGELAGASEHYQRLAGEIERIQSALAALLQRKDA